MKKKKVLIAAAVVLALTIMVIFYVLFRKDLDKTNSNIDTIKKNYENFSSNVPHFNEIRMKYTKMSSELTIDNYDSNKDEYEELLKEYNGIMKNMDSYIGNINYRCKQLYSDTEVNKICNSYKSNYEKIVNLYVSDLMSYNNFIVKYNEYNDASLSTVELLYSDYLDYNEDGIYEGREVNEEN